MIDIREFRRRYKIFERLDSKNHPHTFHQFWKYKLKVENQDTHILDNYNKIATLTKLRPILKIWQWHRPYQFKYCFQLLEKSVENISDSYNEIRKFSLIKFDEIPEKYLEKIWNELGSIKDQGTHNPYGKLVMTITKPLMFLWGQTPAFDSVVRAKMPSFNLEGFENTRWGFNLWISVMKKLQGYLNHDTEIVVSFRKMSIEKYGTDEILPFGQFFDLYYWTEDKRDDGSKKQDSACKEKKPVVDLKKTKQQEEFRNLVELLGKLKRKDKISDVEWRSYSKQWRDYPHHRDLLVERLKLMLEK